MQTSLVFREKIARSTNTCVLSIPNLTSKGLILGDVHFETNDWYFEISLRSAAGELVRMNTSYLQHYHDVDLSGLRSKIEEGDKLELVVKPKQAPRDIELIICYTYIESSGAIYYQSQDSLLNLSDSLILVDISQGNRPTFLEIKCENPIESITFTPKFNSSDSASKVVVNGNGNQIVKVDFTQPEFSQIIPLMRYYQLKIVTNGEVSDPLVYFLARGFKV